MQKINWNDTRNLISKLTFRRIGNALKVFPFSSFAKIQK